ncbi:MAG: hypothetical protein IJH32_10650 [Ruminococcus sp.]|nr:hypothetical protein [Ruminococcus sp.]
MKELYERTELNVTEFLQEDVIVTSSPEPVSSLPDNSDTGNDNPMPIKV